MLKRMLFCVAADMFSYFFQRLISEVARPMVSKFFKCSAVTLVFFFGGGASPPKKMAIQKHQNLAQISDTLVSELINHQSNSKVSC